MNSLQKIASLSERELECYARLEKIEGDLDKKLKDISIEMLSNIKKIKSGHNPNVGGKEVTYYEGTPDVSIMPYILIMRQIYTDKLDRIKSNYLKKFTEISAAYPDINLGIAYSNRLNVVKHISLALLVSLISLGRITYKPLPSIIEGVKRLFKSTPKSFRSMVNSSKAVDKAFLKLYELVHITHGNDQGPHIEGDEIINKNIDKLNIEGEKVSSDLQVVKSKIRKDLESGIPLEEVKEKYKSEVEKSKKKVASLVEGIVEDLRKEKGSKPGIINRFWTKLNNSTRLNRIMLGLGIGGLLLAKIYPLIREELHPY
jgi:hypothetical protein